MKLTTKGRYAVMAMADLALFKDKGPISLTDISIRQNISLAYLEQIFIKLKQENLVKSVRGAKRRVCIRGLSRRNKNLQYNFSS